MGQPVPAAGLHLGAPGTGPHGCLGGEGDEVRAHLGPGDARRPGIGVAVGVADDGGRMVGAQAGVVGEDDPGVHLQAGVGQRPGGRGEGVRARHPVLGVRAQGPPGPAGGVRRVEHGGVPGGDDAVAGMARGEGAGGVVGGGQGGLLDAEGGEASGGVRVADHVPGVEEGGGAHQAPAPGASGSRARPWSISAASSLTCAGAGSFSGGRTSPTSRPRSRTPALTSETA